MRKGFTGISVQTRNPRPIVYNTSTEPKRQPRPSTPPKPTLLDVKKKKIKITFD